MIFYFSATGNSKYVAENIARELGTEAKSIVECLDNAEFEFCFPEDEPVGIVSPVYFMGIPKNVREFAGRATIDGGGYLFCVLTYNMTTGASGSMLGKLLSKKDKAPDAFFSIRMPGTYTVAFNVPEPDAVKKINEAADKELVEAIGRIKSRETGNWMKRRLPLLAGKIFHSFYERQSKTSPFTVEETCDGCGLCEAKCPAHAIAMREGKPIWVRDRCAMCLGCLHRCPKFAIQYGKNTKAHGQYLHPSAAV